MSTIPASNLINGIPNVISAGSSPVSANGVLLTKNALVFPGSVQSYANAAAVGAYFGLASTEYTLASHYFNANDNATQIPSVLYFAPYVQSNISGQLVGASLTNTSIATINALGSGTITVNANGSPVTSASINLSSAVSLTQVASLINTGFSSTTVTCSLNANNQLVLADSTTTYTLAFPTTSAFTTGLLLTAATGAIVTPPALADTPASAMANVVANLQNFITFSTVFEPNTSDKVAFAAWNATQGIKFAYIFWDTDANAIVANSTTTARYLMTQATYEGCLGISGSASTATAEGTTLAALTSATAAFVMGTVAAIDFGATNGRQDICYITQNGLLPTVSENTAWVNLESNLYSSYGAFATQSQGFDSFQDGNISGNWKWLDSYVNAVYMKSLIQADLLTYRTQVKSVPYNPAGYAAIKSVIVSDMQQMLNFGAVRAGVTLSADEILLINTAAGTTSAATSVSTSGYYIQVLDPGAVVRGNRGSPIVNIWYADGGSIHRITFNSFEVQ